MTTPIKLATALAALLLISADAPDAPIVADGDLARLQGTWATQAGPKKNIPVTLQIKGHSVTVMVKPPIGRPIIAEGELEIDETVAPKALDWRRFTGGDDQEFPEVHAIYQLEGEDLIVCNAGPNNPRPAEFRPGEGVLAEVLRFKRLAGEPADASAPTAEK
jgi:uncharacterized protein (TIGR03067 family)